MVSNILLKGTVISFEVFMSAVIKIMVIWEVMLNSTTENKNKYFAGILT
jgi:hypothetical protein